MTLHLNGIGHFHPEVEISNRFLEDLEIEGKYRKPEITIFITRQNLSTDYELELRESFVPKIVKSVEKKPF